MLLLSPRQNMVYFLFFKWYWPYFGVVHTLAGLVIKKGGGNRPCDTLATLQL